MKKKEKWVMSKVYLLNNQETSIQEPYNAFLSRLFPDSGAGIDTVICLIPDSDSDGTFQVAFTRHGISFKKI